MCGFSGVISNFGLPSNVIVDSLAAIKHRGPDDTLIFTGDQIFFSCGLSNPATKESHPQLPSGQNSIEYFGFNRLSIVDLSANAMQPFFDEASQTCFMLNGEIYNYKELKNEFLSGESFISQSDSEVAFRLFLKLGDSFVDQLRGMFSIVAYNFRTKQLKAWRDRLGMKPFYYSFVDGVFIFSSEMKGIFATQLLEKEINYHGLAYSMYLGTCPSPLTIFSEISSLQAGSKLEYNHFSAKIKTEQYWHLEYRPSKREITFEEFNADLMELCQLHRTGDVEKALMLSGGMDSGTLAWYFSKFDPKLKCLNIFASNHLTDERKFASANAANANLEISCLEIPASPSEEQVDACLLAEEEPNSIPEPAVFLCDEARKMGIEVLYSALGPDEIFGGYKYFETINKLRSAERLLKITPAVLIPAKFREKFTEVKQFGLGFYPIICRRLFTWAQIARFLTLKGVEIPEHPITYLENQVLGIYPGFKSLPVLKKASYLEIFYFISSHHTFRSDQPSMRFSIEMRFPFLDHQFIEKYFNQTGTFEKLEKYLKPQFREYVSNILPPEIFKMDKRGFSMPTEPWTDCKQEDPAPGIEASNSSQLWYLKMLRRIELPG